LIESVGLSACSADPRHMQVLVGEDATAMVARDLRKSGAELVFQRFQR